MSAAAADKLIFVFPGQGAQAVGMGRDFYDNIPEARAIFEVIDAACGTPISQVCFEGPEEALAETRYTQPALFAASLAAWAACRTSGLTPVACAGHSIGEYAALVAAGALTVEEGARLVWERARAMATAASETQGTMAAVLGLSADAVALACSQVNPVGVATVANYNAPGQIVISGEIPAVEAATVLLKEKGAKRVLPLAVSGAFHSPLMALAAGGMQRVLQVATVSDPTLPIVANVTADYETTAAEVRRNLATQVAGSVRWIESIERLVGDGYTTFIECGPGKVLAGLIKRIAPDAMTYSIGDRTSLEAAKQALGATS